MFRVLKPLPAGTGLLEPGEVVDAAQWRNLKSLVASRYLEPCDVSALTKERKKPGPKPRTILEDQHEQPSH